MLCIAIISNHAYMVVPLYNGEFCRFASLLVPCSVLLLVLEGSPPPVVSLIDDNNTYYHQRRYSVMSYLLFKNTLSLKFCLLSCVDCLFDNVGEHIAHEPSFSTENCCCAILYYIITFIPSIHHA